MEAGLNGKTPHGTGENGKLAMTSAKTGTGALVCIPTYNEQENVDRIVPAVLEAVPNANVLVVDDNSPDGTGKTADRLAASDSRIHVLHRASKEGLGKAYLAAFAWAIERGFEVIVEFDADFSHNPAYLPDMFEGLTHADVVVLKTGKKFDVEKVWRENDQIWIIFHGMRANIPQSKVARIESKSNRGSAKLDSKKADRSTIKSMPLSTPRDIPRRQTKKTARTASKPQPAKIKIN